MKELSLIHDPTSCSVLWYTTETASRQGQDGVEKMWLVACPSWDDGLEVAMLIAEVKLRYLISRVSTSSDIWREYPLRKLVDEVSQQTRFL